MPSPRKEPLDSYLSSFINYERYKYFPKKVNLADYRNFLKRIGDPQDRIAPSILIAGTNGKGSTAAILSAILGSSGYRVGTFSSPHLFSYRERIKLNGKPISAHQFKQCVRELKPVIDEPYQRLRRTFFEVLTTIAFIHFKMQRTDVNVLEVGLGGRKDSTNVVTPLISVITAIGFDHTRTLGRTLSRIAREKCGIIRVGGTVVSSRQHRNAMKVIRQTARKRKANFFTTETECSAMPVRFDERGIHFRYEDEELRLPLRGHFQWDNLCTALLTIELIRKRGFSVSQDELKQGLERCALKGRFDIVAREPLTVFDGAHNPSALRALLQSMVKLFPGRELVVIFSCLSGKDVRHMARIIERFAPHIILTQIQSERAAPLDELRNVFRKGIPVFETVGQALAHATRHARRNSLMLVTGSIYLVAEAYLALKSNR